MSKLTQIEAAIKRLDQAGFQRLGDAYLRRRGYVQLNPIGLALGAEKTTTGTPDTLVVRPDGSCVFVEYTTEQRGVAAKFSGDLDKCFDQSKTGVPPDRIAEVILCHNGKLSPAEEYALAEKGHTHGTVVTTVGLGHLAGELYDKHPGLARDFLGIDVDTGQVLAPDDFTAAYAKGAFATPLDTPFQFRESEVDRVLAALDETDVVLLTGRPGAGKSRLALECARRYAVDHPETQVRCVFNRGADLYQDLRTHFAEPGHYLLVLDDANRLTRFDYALELLRDAREDRTFKILATVRDYALDGVRDAARPFGVSEPIEVGALSADQIRTLVEAAFDVTHHAFLERIAEIAQGNPRLAVMAARVARDANSLASIADASDLYDQYFHYIRQDLADLHDPTLLRVAAVVAFFRHVDRTDAEFMGAIERAFGLPPDVFWRAARRLHEWEVLDLYEDEVVRVADQVLATYLFHLAVFEERVVDLGVLLTEFFPRFRHRLIDALNPVASTFNGEAVTRALRPPVLNALQTFEARGDAEAVWHLLEVFASVVPTEALVAVQEAIAATDSEDMSAAEPAGRISFAASSNTVPHASPLGVLAHFRYAEPAARGIALDLIVTYLERRSREAPLVVRLLTEDYGIRHRSYLEGFAVERDTAAVLAARAGGGRNTLAARLVVAYAGAQLHTRFHRFESGRGLTFTSYNFDVPATDELLALRRFMWDQVLPLYGVAALRDEVVGLLAAYIGGGLDERSKDVIAADAPVILGFFRSDLDASDYAHGVVAKEYLAVLERVGLAYDPAVADRFAGGVYELADLLLIDHRARSEEGWEAYTSGRGARLAAYGAGLDADALRRFLAGVEVIRSAEAGGQRHFELDGAVTDVLLAAAGQRPADFANVFVEHLRRGNAVGLQRYGLVAVLIATCGVDGAYEGLQTGDYPDRQSWLFAYFAALPPEAVTAERLATLYRLYEVAAPAEIRYDLSYLLRFSSADPDVLGRVVRILVARAETEPRIGHVLKNLFDNVGEFPRSVPELLPDVETLKRAYFAANVTDRSVDHDGRAFDALVTADSAFLREWVAWVHANTKALTRRDDPRDYAFVWRRPDADRVMRDVVDAVRSGSKGRVVFESYLLGFFTMFEGTRDAEDLRARQDAFLDAMLGECHNDPDALEQLFEVIRMLAPERRRGRIAALLTYTQDFAVFKRLPLEPNQWGWSGSAVPMHQGRADFFESLLPLFNTPALLPHRRRVTEEIEWARATIEKEKRRDFQRD